WSTWRERSESPLQETPEEFSNWSRRGSALRTGNTGNARRSRSASAAPAAGSVYFRPSAVSNSEVMPLSQSCFSNLLSSLIWTATRVLPCWSALATLVMVPPRSLLTRVPNKTTADTTMMGAAAIKTGTTGGRVHLARSSSSDIGTCPASGAGAGAAGCGDGDVGWEDGVSGIRLLLRAASYPEMLKTG